jgi:parallel beta-helix repeat protein
VTVIYGGNPVQHNNRIHDNNQDGVHVYEAGKGTLEGNDIFANAYHGVEIREGGHPTVRDNRINENQQWLCGCMSRAAVRSKGTT